jgi:hypothetical protein
MMKIKKLLTIFVAVLIISLPVCFATSFTITRSSGDDNIDNYYDGYIGTDSWTIEVEAELSGILTGVTVGDIYADFVPRKYFDSCQPSSVPNHYDCSLQIPSIPLPEGTHSVDIVLYNPVFGDTDIKPAIIKVDNYAPIVTINSAEQDGYNVSVDFNVEDGGNQVCSIDWIEFIDTNTSLVIDTIDVDITDCNTHNYDVQLELLDIGTTTKTIEIKAYDGLGHENEIAAISDPFVLDHTPPMVNVNSFRFTSLGGAAFISGDPITTDITINITEETEETPLTSPPLILLGDFSAIGPGATEYTEDCVLVDDVNNIYTCTWSDMDVTLPNSFSVTITAIDAHGNGEGLDTTIQKTFSLDSTAPTIEYLGGIESYYVVLDDENILRATFQEGESGINAQDIQLTLEEINPGYPDNLPADTCSQQGINWNCYWNVTATRAGEIKLAQAKDRADNFVLNLRDFDVDLLIDDAAPSVTDADISIYAVGFGGGTQTGLVEFYEEERDLYIEAIVTDASGVKAWANFSGLVANTDEVEGICTQQDGSEWLCTWTVGPLASVTDTTPKNIVFTFEDFVGNEAAPITKTIDVLSVGDEDTNPDYWSIDVGASTPASGIDRRLVTRMFPYVWFPIELSPVVTTEVAADQWPLLVKDLQCTPDWLTSYEIINSNTILPLTNQPNTEDNSVLPYTFWIKLTMIQLSPTDADSVVVPCTFKTMSYIDQRVIPNPEIENVNLTVTYFNNPLGEIADEVQTEIDDVKSGWLVEAGWLSTTAEILAFLETICTGLKIIHDVTQTITVGVDGLANCCASVYASPACCPTKRSTGAATTASKEGLEKAAKQFGNKFCKALNCQLSRKSKLGEGARGAWDRWVDWAAQTSGSHKGYFGNVQPEDSIILSIIFLCFKGVIYNLEKARQIDCRYVYCLEQTAEGMPVNVCVYQRALAMCKYVFNQIFNLIPFASVFSDIFQHITQAFTNWQNLLGFATKLTCRYGICNFELGFGCKVCSVIEWFNWLFETLCDLGIGDEGCLPFWDTVNPVTEDYCDKIEDD